VVSSTTSSRTLALPGTIIGTTSSTRVQVAVAVVLPGPPDALQILPGLPVW